ncbi:hypothetical protein WN944_022531 [Citrus x changshan-huyou]|uniref:Uncharacterized protein n=1 Tax=Citrus x changshan-huyou TaxID=2935761 RepID=A0AAP0N101_9ROSI
MIHTSGAHNEGYYNIGVLRKEEDGEGSVTLHDVIRDMALWIAYELAEEEENFWFMQPCLKVLNLSNSPCLEKLPSRISRLVSLQHLDLSSSGILELPKELGFLGNLACLNLENTSSHGTITRQLISNFSKPQVLRMFRFYGKAQDMKADSLPFGGSEFLLHNCMRGLELFGGASRPNSEHTRSLEVLPLAEMRQLDKLHIAFCTRLQEFEIECPGETAQSFRRIQNLNSFEKLELIQFSRNIEENLSRCIALENLKGITVSSCPNLKRLPLNSNSDQRCWSQLQWEDEATQYAFLPCFKPDGW